MVYDHVFGWLIIVEWTKDFSHLTVHLSTVVPQPVRKFSMNEARVFSDYVKSWNMLYPKICCQV